MIRLWSLRLLNNRIRVMLLLSMLRKLGGLRRRKLATLLRGGMGTDWLCNRKYSNWDKEEEEYEADMQRRRRDYDHYGGSGESSSGGRRR